MLQFSLRSAVFCWFESSITMDTRWILQDAVLFHQHKQKAGIRGRSARWRLLYKAFSAANWRKSGHKSARRKRPSTQYPPRQMPAQRMGLNFLQKLLIHYGRVALSISEKKIVIVSMGKLHFYGTDKTRFFIRRSRRLFLRKKQATVHVTRLIPDISYPLFKHDKV